MAIMRIVHPLKAHTMNARLSLLASALMFACTFASAAPPRASAVAGDIAGSADIRLPGPTARTAAPKAGPSAADVGDADSFGRSLNWLGLADAWIELTADCTGSDADRCQELAAAPATTTFAFDDVGHVTLPRNAANSLMCYWFSPYLQVDYANPTTTAAIAELSYVPTVTVENPVLDDPALIDPNTGLPFGGSLLTGMTSSARYEVPLAAGQHSLQRDRDSAVCIAGLISRQSLMQNYGLSDAQARQFFRKPTTLRLNVHGSAQFVGDASLYFGLRIVGD
jgi:hypothetical protein